MIYICETTDCGSTVESEVTIVGHEFCGEIVEQDPAYRKKLAVEMPAEHRIHWALNAF